MVGDNVIITKVAVEFFRYKISRTCFARFDTVNDEIKMIGKCFNFGLVARLKAVFNRKGVKMENLEHNAPGFLDLFGVFP